MDRIWLEGLLLRIKHITDGIINAKKALIKNEKSKVLINSVLSEYT